MIDTKEIREWILKIERKEFGELPLSVNAEDHLYALCDELDAEREKVRVAVVALGFVRDNINAECECFMKAKDALTQINGEGDKHEVYLSK